eukprot:4653512-Karenia_brevis.AAC.1
MRLWLSRRWWEILSVVIQRAVTFNLAPSLGPQELVIPLPTLEHLVASAINPPDVSRAARSQIGSSSGHFGSSCVFGRFVPPLAFRALIVQVTYLSGGRGGSLACF